MVTLENMSKQAGNEIIFAEHRLKLRKLRSVESLKQPLMSRNIFTHYKCRGTFFDSLQEYKSENLVIKKVNNRFSI